MLTRKGPFLNIPPVTMVTVFLSFLIAILALSGWIFNISLLRSFNPAWPTIKANTSLGIIFSGISLLLWIQGKRSIAFLFAAIVFLLGIVTLFEHIFHFNAYIDELFFLDQESSGSSTHGRMPQLTSIAFTIIGLSLLTYSSKIKWIQNVSQVSVMMVLILSFAGFIGAFYNAGKSFRAANIASFSIPTAISGLLISIGILFSRSDIGLLSVFHKKSVSAKAILRGIFISIAILVVFGWLCLKGEKAGLFDNEMGLVIMIATFTISFLLIALSGIQRLNKSEDLLIASEKNLRHVLSSTADVYYVIDRNYKITLINEMATKNLTKAWGKPVTLGANILELIPSEKNEPIHESFERVFKGEKIEYELHQTKWNDLPEWVLVSYKPVIDNDGTVIGAYIVTKDITVSRKAEEELKQSNNRFELISRTTNDAIWEWDLETGQLWSNETHQQLYGLTINDTVPGEDMWASRIHPDDRQKILNKQEASLFSNKNVFISEYRFNVEGKGYRNIYDRCYIVRNEERKAIRMMGSMMDVTEQKKIEDELRKSEERYRSLIEQASDYIMITDTKGNFIDVNSSLCKAFGYFREELLGMNISQIIDPLQLKNDPIRFDILLEGRSMLRERRMMNKDGSIVEVEANVKMLPDGRILAIVRDIAERKKAEAELRRSEETRRLIMDSALDAIVGMDTNGAIMIWTPQAEKIFGWNEKEIIGKTIADTIIPQQYRERHKAGLSRYLETGKGNQLNKLLEITALDNKGREFPIEISIIPVNQGETRFFCAFIRDITERLKSQQLIAKEKDLSDSIINSMPGVFYLFDENGKYLRWNKLKEIITGYSHEEIQGMSPLDFFEGEEKENIRKHIEECFRTGETKVEASITTKDGKNIPFFFTGIALEYEGKRCLLGTAINIMARKKAEEEVQQSYEAIRKLTEHLQNIREEERTHIAREIHDELGQQLTVLKMDASWLNKKLSISEESVKQKLRDLLELLDGTVRTVRKISSELRPSLLDDMGLVAAMEWHLKEFEKRTTVKTKFSVPQQDLLLSDTRKTGLFRIFQESLTNVARHADAKKVEVKLQQQNGNIILSIKDDGKGFEKGKAVNKKTLGILGMEERSFMMGGSYQINSKPGEGTLVVVSVPA